ncbi:hypothetical protein [Salinibacillus xinjiangensis]|uniref:hypothetical protein n=1 Tax=Salinibacillus xinjiangensis TaxID=1229268 RepID=UPI00189119A4|nr:hypothetical protein [Salinibacillus xinjiangensis]
MSQNCEAAFEIGLSSILTTTGSTLNRAKVTGDLLSVFVAGAICLTFIKSFGSIGIGTLIAAYFIGKF